MAGPIKPDMELQREVRRLTLKKIRAILIADKDDDLSRAVLLKLAGTVLPRINEHTGEDGGAIEFINNINYILPNGNNSKTNAETTPSV
jgi:hypothetical protein